jgi:hypothetical protein
MGSRMPANPSNETIIAELRARHESRYGKPDIEVIEAGRVRDFLFALDEPAQDIVPGVAVPSLFLLTLGRTRRPRGTRGSAVNAGDAYEFFAPVHVGDTIRTVRELLGIDAKQGKQGVMYLTRTRSTYTNQRGEQVAVSHQNTLRWGL